MTAAPFTHGAPSPIVALRVIIASKAIMVMTVDIPGTVRVAAADTKAVIDSNGR